MESIDKYLQNLVKYAGDAIFTVGKTQTVLSWNLGAEELFGHTTESMVGKGVDILSPYDNKRMMRSLVMEAMEEGTLKNLECELIHQNGRTVSVYLTASPIRDANENVVAVSIIAKDVTDQNKLLFTLIEKQKRQAHLEALMESLTTISHYIRNAAAVISAKAEVSKEVNQIDTYQTLVSTCMKETKRIAAVIDSLNDMVREVEQSGDDIETTHMNGAPSRVIDIETRLKERLKKIDEEKS
ncbi:PAS domain S-box protein [bacterium]|nr:MAG: PAS domain S-box protein [bacterium]